MDVSALIIARGGSERVPRKNVKEFADKCSLIELKISQLNKISALNEVVVNSDDDEILEIAKENGATAVKRDPHFGKATTPMVDVYSHVASGMNCEQILFANCTSPLIKSETLSDLCLYDLDMKNLHSVNTVNYVQKFMVSETYGPLYDMNDQPRSQDIKNVYEINWAAAVVEQEYMATYGRVVGHRWEPYFIDDMEAVDIDTMIDWEVARQLWKAN